MPLGRYQDQFSLFSLVEWEKRLRFLVLVLGGFFLSASSVVYHCEMCWKFIIRCKSLYTFAPIFDRKFPSSDTVAIMMLSLKYTFNWHFSLQFFFSKRIPKHSVFFHQNFWIHKWWQVFFSRLLQYFGYARQMHIHIWAPFHLNFSWWNMKCLCRIVIYELHEPLVLSSKKNNIVYSTLLWFSLAFNSSFHDILRWS